MTVPLRCCVPCPDTAGKSQNSKARQVLASALEYRDSGSTAALFGVGGGSEAHLDFEVMNQMGLIVVTEIACDRGPVDWFSLRHEIRALLDARTSDDPFETHADVLLQNAMKTSHRKSCEVGQVRSRGDGTVVLSMLHPRVDALNFP